MQEIRSIDRNKYDQLWTGAWGDQQRLGPVHRRQREELVKLIATLEVHSVLDVGCGSGDNLAALAHAMPHIALSGVDVSEQALALASQRVPGASLRQLDVQKDSLNQRFDLVLCNQVIEHLLDDVAALGNIAVMAKRWVVVATMRGRMRRSEQAIGHLRNYSDGELRAKALSAGLVVTDVFGWGFPFYSPLYRTFIEWLPGGPPEGELGTMQKAIAKLLYYLYAFNVPRRGDVVTVVARPQSAH